MLERVLVQVIDQARGPFDHRLHRRVLAVQHAQRICVQAPAAVLVQPLQVLLEVLDQARAVARPRLGAAQGIDLEGNAVQSELLPQACAHGHVLGVHVRAVEAQCFHAYLMELAKASLCGRSCRNIGPV